MATWSHFLTYFISRITQNIFTIIPALYLIDYLRPTFIHSNPTKVSLVILSLLFVTSTVYILVVLLVLINTGWLEYVQRDFVITVSFTALYSMGFTVVSLLYFMRRYRELTALKQSFEYKLEVQSDLIKARIAPHFFFNTINTLVSLIESEPARAANLLQHISVLFRASFNGAREIGFEEEIALCEHYLAIESCRLADKLVISWDLPDDDIMYDMVIAALTLQNVLEKIILNMVEMTIKTVYVDIKVTWQQDRVTLTISAQLPDKSLMISHDLRRHIDFHIQTERLKTYFGQSAYIKSKVTNQQIVTVIDYPLQDVSI